MKVHEDFNLQKYLWYKIGGTARYVLEVSNAEDILKAVQFIQKNKIEKVLCIGLGSNLIFAEEYFDGAIILFKPSGQKPVIEKDKYLTIFAGDLLDTAIQESFENNLIGLEWAGGLPGTAGAGVRGNVGAFGGEIKDSFKRADVIDLNAKKPELFVMKKKEMRFDYRNSNIKRKRNLIVASVTFQLNKVDDVVLGKAKQTYNNNIEYRRLRHPLDFPNCGSVFKNISEDEQVLRIMEVWPDIEERVSRDWRGKVSMGYLIKRLELSGRRIGNAQISEKHGNFIINLGGATASDVLSLITLIQNTFLDIFEFSPEVEVEIVS